MKVPVTNRTTRPPTQDTWRQLIRLLLAFKGERTDNDMIGDYQCDAWGSSSGETCAPELSALAALGMSVQRERTAFSSQRTAHLRKRVLENEPRFVVMYGGGKTLLPNGNYVATGDDRAPAFQFEAIEGWSVGFKLDGPTKFVRASHPVKVHGPAPPDEYWLAIAKKLCEALSEKPR